MTDLHELHVKDYAGRVRTLRVRLPPDLPWREAAAFFARFLVLPRGAELLLRRKVRTGRVARVAEMAGR